MQKYDLDKGNWYVTEKVYGANFSIIYNGKEFRSGKRNSWVGSGDEFYNSASVVDDNKEFVEKIFKQICDKYRNVKFITIFGELCGGHYPHEDVEVNKEAKLVQRGVYYSPDNLFYAF